MERIQERALRAVFRSKSETYSKLLTRAGLLSLYQQRLQNIAIFMYKVKNGLMPSYITEIFNTTPKRYNLRNADFNIPRFRIVHYGKHSLRYFGSHLWNKLEESHKENPNLMSFKEWGPSFHSPIVVAARSYLFIAVPSLLWWTNSSWLPSLLRWQRSYSCGD